MFKQTNKFFYSVTKILLSLRNEINSSAISDKLRVSVMSLCTVKISLLSVIDDRKYVIILRKVENEGNMYGI